MTVPRGATIAFQRVVSGGTDNEGFTLKQDYLQMRVLELAPEVYVSGQVFETDMKLAAGGGVRTIVNNRFDDETPGQPSSAALAKAADEHGIEFVHFPVEPKAISDDQLDEYAKLCDGLKRPILVFSRTGARSTRLWEMMEAKQDQ